MKIRTSRLCVQTSVWVLASAFCVTSLTGCGANGNFTQGLSPDTATSVAGLSGTVHGGPNPVTGATVTLYATQTTASPSSANNYGYGVAGEVLGTTTTGSGGDFSFTGSETACPAGQQAYIVAAGGHTGSNSANTAAVLMAALGPCSSITEGSGAGATTVIINEPTTIAAAYALGQFMSVTGSGSSTVVNISAPANNNAATPTCTVVSNATTACAASGLAHAFLNAATLVNSTTGTANSTVSGNSTAVVPQALINTLANTVEACVNSSGSGSTACTTLMGYSNYANLNPSISTAPTNTLQALQYMALYPVAAASPTTAYAAGPPATGIQPSAATQAFFNIANGNAYYSPALTSAPLDYTIAIYYPVSPASPNPANSTPASPVPWGIATDISDNVYVYFNNTPPSIVSVASDGASRWTTATTEASAGGCSTYGTRCGVIPDTLGNLWVTDNKGLTELSTSGTLGTTYATVDTLTDASVDLGNNVWAAAYTLGTAGGTQTAPSALEEFPQGGTAIADVQVGGAVVSGTTPLRDPVFDSAGNLWVASDNVGGNPGAVLMISTNNSLTAPNFSFSSTTNPALIPGGIGSNLKSSSPNLDASGNLWISSEDQLNEVLSGGSETGGATNYATSMTPVYGGSGSAAWESTDTRYSSMDGDAKIVVDAAAGGIGYLSVYYPNATSDGQGGTGLGGANVYLNPCYVASSTTTCALNASGGSIIMNASRQSAVDASGAIWATFSSGGQFIQVLGPGAPLWPQASYIPEALLTNTSRRPY